MSVLSISGSRPAEAGEGRPLSADTHELLSRFDAAVRHFPTSLAVTDGNRSFSYAELAALTNTIAGNVFAAVGEGERPVAILLPSEARYLAAMLGTLAAGRGFLLLDADHPEDRNRAIAANAGAAAVVSAGDLVGPASTLFPDAAVVDLDGLDSRYASRPALSSPGDLACIVYTSGSTGRPKGVAWNRRDLHAALQAVIEQIGLDHTDRMSMVYSPAAVTSVADGLRPALTGASLHVLPPRELGAVGIVRAIGEHGITMFAAVPTLFRHVAESADEQAEELRSVRLVMLAGEPCFWTDFDLFRRAFPPTASLLIRMGSTECLSYSLWFADSAARTGGERLPIGVPPPSLEARLVDEAGQAVPDGDAGELLVTGTQLSQCYWNDPEATARFYRTDPADPAVRTFRTGDLVRRRPDGLYEFLGRKDHQIKLHGHRIEPAEIESALRSCDGVRDGAVVPRRGEDGKVRALIAYVELAADARGLVPRHIQAMLSRTLPAHMVPASVVILPQLPRLPSFKVDRRELEGLAAARAEEAETSQPHDPLIDEIARVFEAAIGIIAASGDDNVASLGGDSLQALEIVAALEERFQVSLPVEMFTATESIRDLANWVRRERQRRDAL